MQYAWYEHAFFFALLSTPAILLIILTLAVSRILKDPAKAFPRYPRLGVVGGVLCLLLVAAGNYIVYHATFGFALSTLTQDQFNNRHFPTYVLLIVPLLLVTISIFAFLMYDDFVHWWRGLSGKAPGSLAAPTLPTLPRQEYTEAVMKLLQIPQPLIEPLRVAVYSYTASDQYKDAPTPTLLAERVNSYATALPKNITRAGVGKTWREQATGYHSQYDYLDIPSYLRTAIDGIKLVTSIPLEARKENHIHILAKTRWGKTQLLQSLILDSIEAGIPTIVIDSQEQMINKLATRVPQDNLILIDPIKCPPGINPFDLDNDTASLALLPYMFGGIGSPLIGKQITAFRWLSRLIVEAKGDMTLLYRFLKEPGLPLAEYGHLIEKMGIPGQSFFAEYEKHEKPKGEYKDTRDELVRRLDTIFGDPTFAQMLFAPKTTIDIPGAIREGKTILISTAKPQAGPDAAALIGRFFISQVLRAAMKAKQRVVLVCDEFQDYAEDSQVLYDILSQSAKYGLELVVAHQTLGSSQLPDGLRGQMMTNAAIKLAGGVSHEDRANLARQMGCEPEFIAAANKGTFVAKIGDAAPIHLPVEFGRLEAMPEISRLDDIYAEMARYSPPPPTVTPKTPDIEPRKSGEAGKSFDVDE